MHPIKVTIHSTGSDTCSLTGKEGDGLTVTFEDGTVNQAHLSWKSFKQLLALKTSQGPKAAAKPAAAVLPTGPAVIAPK